MNNNSYTAKSMYSGMGGFGGGSAMRSSPAMSSGPKRSGGPPSRGLAMRGPPPSAPGCGPPPSGSAMSFGGLKIGGSAM